VWHRKWSRRRAQVCSEGVKDAFEAIGFLFEVLGFLFSGRGARNKVIGDVSGT